MQILYFQWEELKFIEQCGEKMLLRLKEFLNIESERYLQWSKNRIIKELDQQPWKGNKSHAPFWQAYSWSFARDGNDW